MSTASWTATGPYTNPRLPISTVAAIATNAEAVNTSLASETTSTTPLQSCSSGAPAVVEFHNTSLDHYFITWMSNEIDILYGGTKIEGWRRTGYFFKTYPTAQPGSSPVCRFYIPPVLGDSHFFGARNGGVRRDRAAESELRTEYSPFMHMFLPVMGGLCCQHDADLSGVQQSFRCQSSLHDRLDRPRTDGHAGMVGGGRWPRPRRDVRAPVASGPFAVYSTAAFIDNMVRFLRAQWAGSVVRGRSIRPQCGRRKPDARRPVRVPALNH